MKNEELAIVLSQDKYFEIICVNAVRYAIDRRTAMIGVTCGFVMRYVELLSDESIYTMIRDINGINTFYGLGNEYYIYKLIKLKDFLIEELVKRGDKND